jgi:hypothetical protein
MAIQGARRSPPRSQPPAQQLSWWNGYEELSSIYLDADANRIPNREVGVRETRQKAESL